MSVPADLDRRFREAAADEGLVDAAFDLVESPLGPLLVGVSDRGVCRISFDPEGDRELEALANRIGPRVLRVARRVDPLRRQLDEYFERSRQDFDVEVDLGGVPAFQQDVLWELVRVPYATTATYGGLAAKIGRPRAARAVGGALNRNPVPIVVPCHRVVGSTGSLTGLRVRPLFQELHDLSEEPNRTGVLADDRVGPERHSVESALGLGGVHHDDGVGAHVTEQRERFQAAHPRQADVAENHVRAVGADRFQGVAGIVERVDEGQPLVANDQDLQQPPDVGFVFDDHE